jgi:cellulose synthase/poly-beta-1,6-N-acetylglucosamine synthase-like glycosyltransferase
MTIELVPKNFDNEMAYLTINPSKPALFTTSLMIGIAVSNEEANIGNLLESLTKCSLPEVESICVVSSGSTDKTNDIVRSFSEKDARIMLITESERNGKSSALNILLAESEKYDSMIYMGGDNMPCQNAIVHLLDLLKTQDVDVVGGRPVPVDDPNTFMGFCTHLLWNLHHESSLEVPKISGELMAFNTKLIRELPPAIINDDAYIQTLCSMKKHRIAYCPEAKVLLKGPSTKSDFITQRRRVFVGHKQLELLIGKKVSTMKVPSWKHIMKACPFKGIKGRVYAIGFISLQGIAFLLAKWDFSRRNLPIKWKLVKTTKNLQCSSDALSISDVEHPSISNSMHKQAGR